MSTDNPALTASRLLAAAALGSDDPRTIALCYLGALAPFGADAIGDSLTKAIDTPDVLETVMGSLAVFFARRRAPTATTAPSAATATPADTPKASEPIAPAASPPVAPSVPVSDAVPPAVAAPTFVPSPEQGVYRFAPVPMVHPMAPRVCVMGGPARVLAVAKPPARPSTFVPAYVAEEQKRAEAEREPAPDDPAWAGAEILARYTRMLTNNPDARVRIECEIRETVAYLACGERDWSRGVFTGGVGLDVPNACATDVREKAEEVREYVDGLSGDALMATLVDVCTRFDVLLASQSGGFRLRREAMVRKVKDVLNQSSNIVRQRRDRAREDAANATATAMYTNEIVRLVLGENGIGVDALKRSNAIPANVASGYTLTAALSAPDAAGKEAVLRAFLAGFTWWGLHRAHEAVSAMYAEKNAAPATPPNVRASNIEEIVELAYGETGVGFDTVDGEASDHDGKVAELRAYLDAASDADVLDALVDVRERHAKAYPATYPTPAAPVTKTVDTHAN